MASGAKQAGVGDALGEVQRRGSFIDTLAEYCYPLYERLLANRRDFVQRIDVKLREALRDTPVELFLSRAIALGLVLGFILGVVGLGLGYGITEVLLSELPVLLGASLPPQWLPFIQAAKGPAIILTSGLLLAATGFSLGFGAPLIDLYYQSYNRERYINQLLPDTIAYMYALSVGGMNHIEILESIADAEEVYGEVAREFQVIVQRTKYFDTDYRSAVRDRAVETPSLPLNQFLTDMLSIATSGGDMTRFFDEKADRHLEIARRRQDEMLDTLELMGEMYLAISLFPLLLIILLVVMAMVGQGSQFLLYLTVYALIPLIGVLFLVIVSAIKQEELSEGYLEPPDGGQPTDERAQRYSVLQRPVTTAYRARHALFRQADRREARYRLGHLLKNPHELFVTRPLATLLVTGPLAALIVGYVYVAGIAPRTVQGVLAEPVSATVLYFYLPAFVTLIPLAVFNEWYERYRYGILENLSETLRKLSSTNDTGLTLLESFKTVAATSPGQLADEFERIHRKVTYGSRLKTALIEFNNRYHIPRLARVVKLIAEAQETSSRITEVLTTAARASENQDELARDRKTRTRMQIAIIVMTYLTLLGVMVILKIQFLDVIARIVETAGQTGQSPAGISLASGIQVERLSMLFFHAVTIQAVVSGLISGYLRDSRLMSGVKYVVGLLVITVVVWVIVA